MTELPSNAAAVAARFPVVDAEPPYEQCRALKRDGNRCGNRMNLSEDGRCLMHDPARADEASAVRDKGGEVWAQALDALRGKYPPPAAPPSTLEGVATWMEWTIVAAAAHALDDKETRSIAFALEKMRTIIRDRDLEVRFRRLQRDYETLKKQLGKEAR
jgi:hypothetical protein